MLRKIIIITLFFTVKTLFSQNPALKVFIDAKQINPAGGRVQASVKVGSRYHSILDTSGKRIVLLPYIDLAKVESFRFIVKADTIVFSVKKILEDLNLSTEKAVTEGLSTLFNTLPKWELHIDYFQYDTGKASSSSKGSKTKTPNYEDYKIYALRTNGLKYYIVKAHNS
jgi:hypothetical protein